MTLPEDTADFRQVGTKCRDAASPKVRNAWGVPFKNTVQEIDLTERIKFKKALFNQDMVINLCGIQPAT